MNFHCRKKQVRGRSTESEIYMFGEVEISHEEVRSGVAGAEGREWRNASVE